MASVPIPLAPDVAAYLRELKLGGVVPGLERMRRLAAALGDPQDRVPVIHIAGTNGKGSVAAMLESILRRAGWRTGLYTSPHLIRLGERIQVDRQPLDPGALAGWVRELRPVVDRLVARDGAAARPSYFEFMTALAFSHFARTRCDLAVVEAGMGGRLDATNVVMPEVSVITSIGLDHCEFLGRTIEAIAGEKAGIIKPGRPVAIGRLPPAAERVVRAVAGERQALVSSVVDTYGVDVSAYPRTNLGGGYQRVNAATATLAARLLPARWRIDPTGIASGLENVTWTARWQTIEVGGRRVIIDSAHNAEGAAALEENLRRLAAETGRAPVVVVGVLGADRAAPLLEVIGRFARELHLVVPAQRRACSHEELERLVPPGFRGRILRDSVAALFPGPGQCLPGRSTDDTVVVAGSIYLAGEVLSRLDPTLGPAESDLQDF